MDTDKVTMAATAHGAIDARFVYLTKRVRIPRNAIRAVRPSLDGEGATVITDRGAMRVCESSEALISYLYGDGADVEGGAR